MKKGFSLIEVLIVIALVFFISCGTIRILMASNKTGIDSNLKTYASVMAHTKFFSLKKSHSQILTSLWVGMRISAIR